MMVERDYAACLIGAAACWMELLLLLDVMAALMVIAYIPINRCCLKSIDSSGSSQLYIYNDCGCCMCVQHDAAGYVEREQSWEKSWGGRGAKAACHTLLIKVLYPLL
jgi:hypothetical protein